MDAMVVFTIDSIFLFSMVFGKFSIFYFNFENILKIFDTRVVLVCVANYGFMTPDNYMNNPG